MSVKALSAAFDDSRATDSAFVVLLAMADWADQNGRCYPSYKQIAEKARVSRATAIESVRTLVKLGEIERVEQGKEPDDSDDQAPANVRAQWRNLYRIVLIKPRGQVVQGPDPLDTPVPIAQVVQPSDPLPENLPSAGGLTEPSQVVQPSDRHIRNRPSDRPSVLKAGARPLTPDENADDNDPKKNLGVITKIVHESFAFLGRDIDLGDLAETVKGQCARLRVAYDADTVRKAIDSALWQRQHKAVS